MDSLPSTKAITGAESSGGSTPTPGPVDPVECEARSPFTEAKKPLIGRLIERSMQAFAGVDFQGRISYANRAFAELTGYTLDELAGMAVADITSKRWHARTSENLNRVRATGQPARYEKEYRRKDGRLVPVEVAVDLNRDEHDEPIGYYAFVTDLTVRKAAEAALRESEERYRRLYDEAPFGYHEIDTEGLIVSINRTECEMLGFAPDEVLGRPVFDFVTEEPREQARQAVREKIEGDRSLVPFEQTLVTRDGRRLIVQIEERYNVDHQGRIVGIRSTVQDITDRKQTETARISSERRARALFEGIEDAVLVHSPEGRILDANPAATRLLGYSRTELLDLSTTDIDDSEFARGYQDRLKHQLEKGHLSCEGRHRTKLGCVIPVEITTSTIQFDGERAILAVIRDITERKALEETRQQFAEAQARNAREMQLKNLALTHSEARYRQLTEGCLDAVVVIDRDGRIVLFNPSAEKTFGYSASEVFGRPLTVLMPEDLRESHRRGFEHYLQTREPRIVGKTVELRGLRKNGEVFPLELSLSAVELAGELQFIGSIRDQTERQRMWQLLVQSEKLASIGLLSAGVAHEINNPLAYVANNLAVLERELKGVLELVACYESAHDALTASAPDLLRRVEALGEELDWPYLRENLARMLGRTRDGVQRVANIVLGLRSQARASPMKIQPVQVPELLDSVLEIMRGRLRKSNIELVVEPGDATPIVCVPSQISQVLLNLFINAVQAIESSGRTEGRRIRFTSRREGEMTVLEVSDNGCGIAPELLSQLFHQPIITEKEVGEGTGLGLWINHQIITGHGGRIEVESRPGAGSDFRVYLPFKSA